MIARMRRALAREDGFTLVELMVVLVLLTVVGGVVSSAVMAAGRTQRRQLGQVAALQEAKVALERWTREVRQANPLYEASPTSLAMERTHGGERRRTRYFVDPAQPAELQVWEERVTLATGAVRTTTRTAVRNLTDTSVVFRFYEIDGTEIVPPYTAADVYRVEIDLRIVPRHGSNPVVLNTDVTLRNWRTTT
jgi:prepilin-type N-terminal cleavage/methylation domain-containing protein